MLHLSIGLSVIRGSSELLNTLQIAKVLHHHGGERFSIVTEQVSWSSEQTKVSAAKSLGYGPCFLVFNHIGHYMFGEVVLHDENIPDNRLLVETHGLLNCGEVNVEKLSSSTAW